MDVYAGKIPDSMEAGRKWNENDGEQYSIGIAFLVWNQLFVVPIGKYLFMVLA